jgi:uncharacterized glyoxalase superfamily protein PhnB
MKKPVSPVPEGYHSVQAYLMVPDAETLIAFAKQVFGAVEVHRTTDSDGNVRHAEIRIGDSIVMLGQAAGEYRAQAASLYVYVPDVDAVYAKALAAGATSLIVPADQFYGDRSGGVLDAQGITWWMGTHIEDVAPDELRRRAEAARK